MTHASNRITNAAAKQTTAFHFAWQRAFAALPVRPSLKAFAWALALYRNADNGRCDPSYAGLAKAAGVSERTAIRLIHTIERMGWIAIERGGGAGHCNQFTFIIPTGKRVTDSCHSFSAEKGDKSSREPAKKGDKSTPKTLTPMCHPNKENNIPCVSDETQGMERERAQERADYPLGAPTPDGGAPGIVEPGDCGTDSEKISSLSFAAASKEKTRSDGSDVRADDAELRAGFAELRANWPRPWDDDDDAEALPLYVIARREVEHDAIMKAAAIWVEGADAPRFLYALPKWLRKRCYLKAPPPKKPQRQVRQLHHKPSAEEVSAELAEQYRREEMARTRRAI
jgi:hypothetical protein